jgi:membrane-associated phospholipid phosphatase
VKLIRPHPLTVSELAPEDGGSRWDKLAVIDWPIARALALRQDRRAPIAAANAVSRLGNGPIYLPIIGAVILFHPHEALTIVLCAAASNLLLHCIYPAMKRATARPRPRDVEAVFPDSIPSGHVMTLTAALLPIVYSAPRTWPLGVAAWAAMSWSRLAIGHHYASDVAAGTILGAAVSGAFAYLIVS